MAKNTLACLVLVGVSREDYFYEGIIMVDLNLNQAADWYPCAENSNAPFQIPFMDNYDPASLRGACWAMRELVLVS